MIFALFIFYPPEYSHEQDFVVDGGMTKAYVTPEGPALAAPSNNALQSTAIDTLPTV
jgi:hypothetical protein